MASLEVGVASLERAGHIAVVQRMGTEFVLGVIKAVDGEKVQGGDREVW